MAVQSNSTMACTEFFDGEQEQRPAQASYARQTNHPSLPRTPTCLGDATNDALHVPKPLAHHAQAVETQKTQVLLTAPLQPCHHTNVHDSLQVMGPQLLDDQLPPHLRHCLSSSSLRGGQ